MRIRLVASTFIACLTTLLILCSTSALAASPPEATGYTTITGAEPSNPWGGAEPGYVLTCHTQPDEWSNSPTSFTYQWFQYPGATLTSESSNPTYTVKPSNIGSEIYCAATGHNAAGTGEQGYSFTEDSFIAVEYFAPFPYDVSINSANPSEEPLTEQCQSGLDDNCVALGQTLKCYVTWSFHPSSVTYKWSTYQEQDVYVKESATSAEYTPTPRDLGKNFGCEATARNANGTTSETTPDEFYGPEVIPNPNDAPPTATLLLNGAREPEPIQSGTQATVSWSSRNATECIASEAWSGTKTTSGSEATEPLTEEKTYDLRCVGYGGEANESATIGVYGSPVCPTGDTGTYPLCVPPAVISCPSGDTGVYPDCVPPVTVSSCPAGDSGAYPNCIPPAVSCPEGDSGAAPHCVAPSTLCPAGDTGAPPSCVSPACLFGEASCGPAPGCGNLGAVACPVIPPCGTKGKAACDDLTESPADKQLLACGAKPIVLTEVYISGNRVALDGVAAKAYYGKKIKIESLYNHQTASTATVNKQTGAFHATAALPPANIVGTNLARYQASSGKTRSLDLKLTRRMWLTFAAVKNKKIYLAGTVTPPLSAQEQSILITRRLTCTKYALLKKIALPAGGKFSVTIPVPKTKQGVVRLQTQVPETATGTNLFTTYTLPVALNY
jgi:hypothetical protein